MIDWLNQWQTMLTGLAAVGAAVVGIIFVQKQINFARNQETGRRARRLTAAKARLPLWLSDIVHFADAAIRLIAVYLDHPDQTPPDELSDHPLPVIPEQAIFGLEGIIESTEDAKFAGVVADLISEIQVTNSRLRQMRESALENIIIRHTFNSYMLNAAKVHAYSSGMFSYARRESDTPPHDLDWNLVLSGLRLNDVYPEEYEDLFESIERARDRACDAIAAVQGR